MKLFTYNIVELEQHICFNMDLNMMQMFQHKTILESFVKKEDVRIIHE